MQQHCKLQNLEDKKVLIQSKLIYLQNIVHVVDNIRAVIHVNSEKQV